VVGENKCLLRNRAYALGFEGGGGGKQMPPSKTSVRSFSSELVMDGGGDGW